LHRDGHGLLALLLGDRGEARGHADVQGDARPVDDGAQGARVHFDRSTLMANLVTSSCLARSMTCTTRPCVTCSSAMMTRFTSPAALAPRILSMSWGSVTGSLLKKVLPSLVSVTAATCGTASSDV